MRLTVLGAGTSVPHATRSSAGFWLETTGGTILLDCSASVLHRMAQERLDWANLDAVWISHFHLDHCGGLAPFLFGIKYAPDTQSRTKPLRIFGPAGLRKLIEAFDAAGSYGLLEQRFPIDVAEVESLEKFEIVSGVEAVAHSTPHTASSQAIHIRDCAATLVYTSDTGFSDVMTAFAGSVDLLLIECSFIRDKPVEIHLELDEAIYMIRKAAPKRAVLTHLYPEWDGFDLAAQLEKRQPTCEITAAFDGLRMEI